MPGKYSYGLVLAQYSSQGIISLPNDEYLKRSQQPRPASAATLRRRVDSNATRFSGHHSIASGSVKSDGATPRPGSFNLTLGGAVSNQKRVIIVQSDSEGEESEDEEWIRPHSRPIPRPTQGIQVRDYGCVQQEDTAVRSSPTDPVISQPSRQPSETNTEAQRNTISPKVTRNRGGGVKAFIQARYEAEMESAAALEPPPEDAGGNFSLREFLQTKQKSSGGRAGQITLQEFLVLMPAPVTDHEEPRSEGNPIPPAFPGTQQPRSSNAVDRRPPPRTTSTNPSAEVAPDRGQDAEPNFDGFSDDADGPRFSLRTMSTQRAWLKATARPSEAPAMKGRFGDNSRKSSAFSGVSHPHQQAEPEPAIPQPFKVSKRGDSRTKQTRPSPAKSQSSMGSLESEATTQATSEHPSTSRTANRAARPSSWRWPRIQQDDNDDSLADLLSELNEKTTIFTSDEEDENAQGGELPTPRLQRIPESEMFSSRKWGTISSGQNVSSRRKDDDEMSEMSAVFPPDIGRYQYVGEGGGPLEMAPAGFADDEEKPKGLKGWRGKPRKGGSKKGFLGRLRIRTGR